jgi:hypothetical protein
MKYYLFLLLILLGLTHYSNAMQPQCAYNRTERDVLYAQGIEDEDMLAPRRLTNIQNPLQTPLVADFFAANPQAGFAVFSEHGPLSNPSQLELLLITPLLMKAGNNDPNVPLNGSGQTVLHYVVDHGYLRATHCLVRYHFVNVNAIDLHGATPLHYAVERNRDDSVRLLLQREDLDLSLESKGKTVCDLAQNRQDIEPLILAYVLDRPVRPSTTESAVPSSTALSFIVASGADSSVVVHGGPPALSTAALPTAGNISRQQPDQPRQEGHNSFFIAYVAGLGSIVAYCGGSYLWDLVRNKLKKTEECGNNNQLEDDGRCNKPKTK